MVRIISTHETRGTVSRGCYVYGQDQGHIHHVYSRRSVKKKKKKKKKRIQKTEKKKRSSWGWVGGFTGQSQKKWELVKKKKKKSLPSPGPPFSP